MAYIVSSLEWTILDDLPGLAKYLPTNLTTSSLANLPGAPHDQT